MLMIREFRWSDDDDYRALASMQHEVYPEYPFSPAEIRHEDQTWDRTRYFLWRGMVDGVGWAQVNHSRHSFVPTTYWLDVGVVPGRRRGGHGSALCDEALRTIGARGGTRVRAGTKESMADGVAFLTRRGFVESKRDWESRLFLERFDFAPFAGARERVTGQGMRISTLKDEMASDPQAVVKTYELAEDVNRDIPATDAPTAMGLETWRRRKLEGPSALVEAYFIAIDPGGRYVGLSELERASDPTFFWQGLTGVRREARGRGIAMALKLETVRYARDRGVLHIKTWNDQSNRPMLAINEALGFERQPAWIELRKDL